MKEGKRRKKRLLYPHPKALFRFSSPDGLTKPKPNKVLHYSGITTGHCYMQQCGGEIINGKVLSASWSPMRLNKSVQVRDLHESSTAMYVSFLVSNCT